MRKSDAETDDPEPDSESFIVIHKNTRGLTNDDRIEELIEELEDEPWDIITINETWRTDKREYWGTKEGHTYLQDQAMRSKNVELQS